MKKTGCPKTTENPLIGVKENIVYLNIDNKSNLAEKALSALMMHFVVDRIEPDTTEEEAQEIVNKFSHIWRAFKKEMSHLDDRAIYDSDKILLKFSERIRKYLLEKPEGRYIVSRYGRGWEFYRVSDEIFCRKVMIPASRTIPHWSLYAKYNGNILRVATVYLDDKPEDSICSIGDEPVENQIYSVLIGRRP